MLIFFRVLQGIGGGGLAPVEQAILVDTFPKEKLGGGLRALQHGDRHGARDRTAARRMDHRQLLVALGILHQRPDRTALAAAIEPAGARSAGIHRGAQRSADAAASCALTTSG